MFNENKIKTALRRGESVVGTWITMANESVAEILSRVGFDWLVVDMEHSAITLDMAQNMIRVIDMAGSVPLVRIGENDPNLIKRVMDAGAYGVVVPMVNSKKDAQQAIASVKYPPLGKRGVGLARAQGYGLGFEEYKNWVNKETVVIAQIEHIEAVDNLEDIFALDDIDAFIVGPYDLSASCGCPGEFNNPEVKKALDKIREVSQRFNKPSGFHVIPPDYKELLSKFSEGYRLLGFSLDSLILGESCIFSLNKIRSAITDCKRH